MTTADYAVRSPAQRGRRRYEPGETIALDDAEAAPLLAAGVVEAPPDAAPETAGEADAGDAGAGADPARAERVRAAVAGLEPGREEHWTKSGKPEVAALRAATGMADVSAAERDAAWAATRGKE